jgi:inhibitor of KinA sporulation pathway (predicted exonuclease)
MKTKHFLVIDFEATCDQDHRISKYEMEIIEIGAVLVDSSTLKPVGEVGTFVRPIRHPKLTAFCTELTTITQGDVDAAPLFPEALAKVKALLQEHGAEDALFCSWGDYDRNQLTQDCRLHGVPYPFHDHLNLKKRFSERQGLPKKLGMAAVLAHVNLKLEGTHHRGIDDARNIARVLPWIVDRA